MSVDKIEIIKDRLTMDEVLRQYRYTPKKRMPCPLHSGVDKNFEIKGKYWRCYSHCGNGDTISFVQKLFGLSFPDTLKKIDVDFNLNIYGNHTFEELRRSHYKQKQLQAENERRQQQKKKINDEYWEVFDEWCRLEKNKIDYAPKTIDEEFHPLYVEALHKLEHQIFELEILEERRKHLE